jgi:hypothetical protein
MGIDFRVFLIIPSLENFFRKEADLSYKKDQPLISL